MKKFYITTSIAYVNGPPHIGFALESVQADAIARFHRQQKDKVFFLTGTDEHGAKIAKAAQEAKKTPKELVDENAKKFKALKKLLSLSWDDFIQTSDRKRHWPNVANLWNKLEKAGDIYKKKYKGLYCVGHEAFVTHKDLVGGRCGDHGSRPEIIEEENYFFRLSKYTKQVGLKIKNKELKIYPEFRAKEVLNFIKEGPPAGGEDISFSRPSKNLPWGIPVPGDDSQTIYVWADALTNYLYPGSGWWPANLHVIGKDILRFHALYWPAMLLSAGLPLPEAIFVHGHITVDNRKMSKTLGNVIDPVELVKKYGVDAVRYYLLREIPPFEDGDFSYRKFEDRYNADLANGLGNFAARVNALARDAGAQKRASSVKEIINFIGITEKAVSQKMGEHRFDGALGAIWELIKFGDAYLNEKKPWKTKDKKVIAGASAILNKISVLLEPFLPETAEKIKSGQTKKIFPRVN